jgi:hypothetical protein
LTTRDTVIGETPACAATSWMVTALLLRRTDFFLAFGKISFSVWRVWGLPHCQRQAAW